MSFHPRLPFWLLCASFLALLSASGARAQCGVNSIGYGDAGLVSGNPFSAEISVERARPANLQSAFGESHPISIARDGLGRVRTERVTGKFKHDNGTEAGTTVEGHMIAICDPVAETLTEIDTLNATAKIFHSRPSAPSSRDLRKLPRRTFCSSRMPFAHGTLETQDLGTKTIEGVEAHGLKMKMPTLNASNGAEQTVFESFTERWCSDDLAALVMTVTENSRDGVASTITMRDIKRNEPDPALFQIPPDYAITESVAEPHVRRNTTAAPGTQP